MNQTAYKSVYRFSLGTRAKFEVTKKIKITREWYITHVSGTPPLGRSVWILTHWVISPS